MAHLPDPNKWRLNVVMEAYFPSAQDANEPGELDHNAHRFSEEARLGFEPMDPESHSLPLENAIFVCYRRHEKNPDTLENKILRFEVNQFETIKQLFAEHGEYFFTIEDSKVVAQDPIEIEIPYELPVIPYAALEGTSLELSKGLSKVVKYKGDLYVYKAARLPDDIDKIAQEARHYQLLKSSKWLPDLGGKVCRQGRNEGFLVRYFEKGDVTRQYAADETNKKRWITQIATALLDFEKLGFYYQDIQCASVVLDDNDSIRFINPGNTSVGLEWAHPDNILSYTYTTYHGKDNRSLTGQWSYKLKPEPSDTSNNGSLVLDSVGYPGPMKNMPRHEFKDPRTPELQRRYTVYGFGKLVWELFVGGKPTELEDLNGTPEWVQGLVNGCCQSGRYKSISEILAYLQGKETLV